MASKGIAVERVVSLTIFADNFHQFSSCFSLSLFRTDESADKNGKLDDEISKPNKSENSDKSESKSESKSEDKQESSVGSDKSEKTENGSSKPIKGGDKVKSKKAKDKQVIENGNDLSNLTV